MSDKVIPLPIARAPKAAPKLAPEQLAALNQALLTAQLRAERAARIEAELRLAQIEAHRAAQEFAAFRDRVGAECGFALGKTHGWDARTGEIVPIAEAKP